MLEIDPLNSNCSQKLQYRERKLRVLGKSNSLEKVAVPKVTLQNANVYNYSVFINTSTMKEWDGCNCLCAFNTVLF